MNRTIESANTWASYESVWFHDNPFPFSSNLGHFDSSDYVFPLNLEYDLAIQDGFCESIPITENVDLTHLHVYDSGMPLTPNLQDNFYPALGTHEFDMFSDIFSELEPEKPKVPMITENGESEKENTSKSKRCRSEEKSNKMIMLSRETISQYFYMPIAQAARQLNIGVTHLKKRCRQLGISRWPHRKLNSLQNLIKTIQELGRERGIQESNVKLNQALEILENEKRSLEEQPDADLKDKTKKLRQACFKANYKKRKIMGIMDSQSLTSNF